MLKDLDDALEKMLDDPGAPLPVRNAEVSFISPARTYAPAKTTLNLFLHDVRENLRLRDPEPIVERNAAGQLVRRPPPLRLDCEYLVTAWPNKTDETAVREGHTLLGLAHKWLSRFATIPQPLLTGALANQAYPPPAVTARTDGKQAIGEFWNALGAPPRPGFSLVVTVAVDPDLPVNLGPPVTAKELRTRDVAMPASEALFQIGGIVRDNAGIPAGGATVTLGGVSIAIAARTATTDAAGRYSFGFLAAGTYDLTAQGTGGAAAPASQVQVAPNAANYYDLSLP
jgi:hypothetical protein